MSHHKPYKNESQDARRKDQETKVHPEEKIGKVLHKEKKAQYTKDHK